MPSSIIGAISGGVQLVSGNIFSGAGLAFVPNGIRLMPDPNSGPALSGQIFISFSGGVTTRSGGALASGGLRDGMPLQNGVHTLLRLQGKITDLFCTVDAATSGARLFWSVY